MFRISKFALLFSIAVLTIMSACRKGDPVNEYYFGYVTAKMMSLPGADNLDVYIGESIKDTLKAGIDFHPIMLSAEKTVTVSFKKSGTDSLILDTTITVPAGETVSLQLAYSSTLGIKTFSVANDANVAADSSTFFLYNAIPNDVMDASTEVDAYLYKYNSATFDYDDTGIMWENVEKGKLHPNLTTVNINDETGATIIYGIKVKNKVTGEYLMDFLGSQIFSLNLPGGQRGIVTLNGLDLGGIYMFITDYANY